MILLSVQNITKKFGSTELFHDINFNINDNDRVAIVGNNGTGKSTLLKIILGEEEISNNGTTDLKGCISIAKNKTIGYLSQNVIESLDNTLKEEALLVFKDVIETEKRMNELANEYSLDPSNKDLEKKYINKVDEFERLGGYDYNYRIEMMLFKFGFSKEVIDRPIKSFSGGERTKMAFIKLLLLKPDLLILDEPTNHLDVSTIDWLEQYLKCYNGAILFVSHDRYFINEVANKVVEIEHNTSVTYNGNFDSYVAQKKANYEIKMKEYSIQQKEIERMKRFIEYFKPKPRFVSRAKDREKKLEHMIKIDKPLSSERAIKFSFDGEIRNDKKIIYFEDCTIGFSDKVLIKPFSFYLFGGDHLAIIGDNGTGKTTLLKTILREIPLVDGSINRLCPLKIGYIQQNDFIFNEDCSILEYLLNLYPLLGEKELRNHLGKFGFHGDDVFKNVSFLSGGEVMRLILAKIVLNDYDVLILDEPTNHLDLITKESLIDALKGFNSCIIFVSHDRYFINSIANKILYVYDKEPYYHEGNYDSFKSIEDEIIKKNENLSYSDKKYNQTVERKPNVSKSKIEKDITILEKKLKEIKEDMFKEENYLDKDKMLLLENKEKEINDKLDDLMNQLLLFE
ncbi:MAG: ABC-F family ATP-binding cassette domain-containing protein [Bacilli bacterium]